MPDRPDDPLFWREYSKELSEFLSQRLGIDPDDLPRSGGWAGSGNSIGALALRLGVLTLDQIEQVVDLQAADGELFGKLAKALDFCDQQDVGRLLGLQHMHRCLDQAALLLVEGRIGAAELLRLLAEFAESEAAQSQRTRAGGA